MREKVITLIQAYIEELGRPCSNTNSRRFRQKVYSIWAAEEILIYVINNRRTRPDDAVEEFACKMDTYSCMGGSFSFMFSVAHDVAIDILDRIIVM